MVFEDSLRKLPRSRMSFAHQCPLPGGYFLSISKTKLRKLFFKSWNHLTELREQYRPSIMQQETFDLSISISKLALWNKNVKSTFPKALLGNKKGRVISDPASALWQFRIG
jgi:hypothetical protein